MFHKKPIFFVRPDAACPSPQLRAACLSIPAFRGTEEANEARVLRETASKDASWLVDKTWMSAPTKSPKMKGPPILKHTETV